ncbi:hypothetical protein DEU56DRAFT_324950 [Suillus clintonianus]|uniref:uncharacterized protein n=1 Tax=Suillus clintonianus TaxID=1904413 RepID=UPI001B85CD5A|nr:uncharacterized protein DEU56DRAFT_324950 [Suillus clintonianus]KAG2139265.1 hypothetical protein DEU56DRAFT_324950 [Suillus clintonianus]
MSQLEDDAYALEWNNNISVAIITLLSYECILQFEKEVTRSSFYFRRVLTIILSQVKFVWGRQWSVMTYLYLVVRYFGVFIAITCACWGGLFYIPEAPYVRIILIWRLYALYNQSKPILYVLLGLFIPVIALYIAMDIFLWSRPSAISTEEVMITPNIKYCTASFHIGPMPAIYASIPIICYDIFLVILAIAVLKKHLRERKELKMRPNTYVIMIVQHHIIYFVLNLACQIFMAILWANLPTVARNLVLLFKDTAPFIIVPRLIISIWDTHANESCVHVSTTFEDCVCWTSPPEFDQHEMGSCA